MRLRDGGGKVGEVAEGMKHRPDGARSGTENGVSNGLWGLGFIDFPGEGVLLGRFRDVRGLPRARGGEAMGFCRALTPALRYNAASSPPST